MKGCYLVTCKIERKVLKDLERFWVLSPSGERNFHDSRISNEWEGRMSHDLKIYLCQSTHKFLHDALIISVEDTQNDASTGT